MIPQPERIWPARRWPPLVACLAVCLCGLLAPSFAWASRPSSAHVRLEPRELPDLASTLELLSHEESERAACGAFCGKPLRLELLPPPLFSRARDPWRVFTLDLDERTSSLRCAEGEALLGRGLLGGGEALGICKYANDNPTRYVDPDGHFSVLSPEQIAAAAAAAEAAGAAISAGAAAAVASVTAVVASVGVLMYAKVEETKAELGLEAQERAVAVQNQKALKRLHDKATAEAKTKAARASLPQDGLIVLEDEDANEELVDRQRREEARKSGTELGQAKVRPRRDDAADEGAAPPRKPGFVPPTDRGTTGGDAESDAANRGVVWVRETPTTRNPAVQDYQSSAPGARSEIATRTPQVPALRFDNPNPRGHDIVRFDGMEGNTLIDRKWSVTSKTKQKADLQRMAVALSQNPGFQGRIEVPNQAQANQAQRVLGQLGITNIDVKVVAPSP